MAECKAVVLPMLSHDNLFEKRLATENETFLMLNVPYSEAIGALMFLSVCTRPDIAVGVRTLAMHVQQPLPKHSDSRESVVGLLYRPTVTGPMGQSRVASPGGEMLGRLDLQG
jgi:hypothetical protein